MNPFPPLSDRRPLRRLATISMAALALASAVFGQERTGAIQGLVTDPSGSAVPGAAVEVTGDALLQAQKITTNEGGAYLFPSLPPGPYNISVSAAGFTVYKLSNVNVPVGRTIRADARLEVGQITETVVVSGEALLIDTANTVVSTNVSSEMYDRLPKGRGFDSLIVMAPGVRAEPKSGGYSADGASGSENSFVLDGVETTDIQEGDLKQQASVPIEWIAETQVKSSGIDAQYGGAIGGVVAATTRSGANAFHGQFSLYLRDSGLNASPRDELRLNLDNDDVSEYFHWARKDNTRTVNPGFRVGGPIKQNMLWFFLSGYPEFENIKRDVFFLRQQETRNYERKERQDYTMGKLDFAPFSRLRANFAYYYNPYRVNGLLPTKQGNDSIDNPWADRGYREPFTAYTWQADYIATSALTFSVFGGYQYKNYKDYGIPAGTRYRYANGNSAVAGVPASLIGPAGNFTPDNRQDVQDIFTRHNVNAIGSYMASAGGQHVFKFGYQLNRLHNSPIAGTWPDGYVFVYWDRAYQAITKPGTFRGQYGHYINRVFATEGDVSSSNQGIFFNDNWRVNRKLTLNLGIRFEREFIPSFDPAIQIKPIEFGFGKKISPRFGFAYDPTGTGKMRFGASYGLYYDTMKYEMPRGSFGGDKWVDYYYTLDSPDIFNIKPTPSAGFGSCNCPGTFIESLNRRIPSHDPQNNLIEPNLLPVRLQAWDAFWDFNFTDDYVFGIRYSHKHLDRTIEDVGILTSQGEQYFIANPGFGITIDENKFSPGFPNDVTPKAKRNYDAVEFRLERRFARKATFAASYTWSRLFGNYAGLASSDEIVTASTARGRRSPNVNRNFDLPWMAYDQRGQIVEGRLATDRPHTFKFFGSYDHKWKAGTLRFSPVFNLFSGTPISTEAHVQGVPVFIFGRGDLGRTGKFTNTNLMIAQDINTGMEGKYFRVQLEIFNLFNNASVLSVFPEVTHANDGSVTFDNDTDIFKGYDTLSLMQTDGIRRDPRYGLPWAYQTPRSMRLGFHFFF
ncbi:MAG: carboxypeptidase regulatory-like domain-containing protein [Bryobacteraceae bacterium]